MAGRGSVGLFSLAYFETNPKLGLDAHVTDVRDGGEGEVRVKVMVDEFGIEHGIKVKGTMRGPHEAEAVGGGVVKVFDKVVVDVGVENKEGIRRLKVEMAGAEGGKTGGKRKGGKGGKGDGTSKKMK